MEEMLALQLRTENPFVEASRRDGAVGEADYQVLLAAARLNEARVREALELIAEARRAYWDESEEGHVQASLDAAAFALGALLPPVNIKVNAALMAALTRGGRGSDRVSA